MGFIFRMKGLLELKTKRNYQNQDQDIPVQSDIIGDQQRMEPKTEVENIPEKMENIRECGGVQILLRSVNRSGARSR